MSTWIYRIALFTLLFGLSPLSFWGNFSSPWLDKLVNLSPIVSMIVFMLCFFRLPNFYKIIAWLVLLGVVLLVLESKYQYGTFVYSYFVIKRFAYCGVALCAYYVVGRAGFLKIEYAVYLILGYFVINQLVLGQIFSYQLTSETRTTLSPDALYLVIPFIYYLVLYLKEHRVRNLGASLLILLIIVLLLHRTVISAGVVAAGVIVGLSFLGKVTTNRIPVFRTLTMFLVIVAVTSPFTDILPESKLTAFLENINGIFSPKEDNTASWRMEQAEYYLTQIPQRPLLGWRYDGYDKGEIMENEDFPDKGTIIHSQYIDQLFNYGAYGLLINVALMLGALVALFRSRRTLSTDQLVLFGFVVSGLVYAVSYQLPVYFWGFVGVATYYGVYPPHDLLLGGEDAEDENIDTYDSSKTIAL